MIHSLINPATHVAAPHTAAVPFSRPSSNFPTIFLRHVRLPRVRLSCNRVTRCDSVASDSKGRKGMSWFHEVEMTVRDSELDQYGVVNNSVYAIYCQHGRHELMKRLDLNLQEIARSGDAFALSQLTLKFLAPLRSGDRFVVKVRVSDHSAVRLFFEHFIFKIPNQEPVLEATATAVWLNKNYRPIRFPAHLMTMSQEIAKQLRD